MQSSGDYNWVKVLPDFVAGVNKGRSLKKIFKSNSVLIDELRIGDYVRILDPRTIFDKASRVPRWSREVYRILTRDHARYVLVDSHSNLQKLAYLPRQLQKTSSPGFDREASRDSQLEIGDEVFNEQFDRRPVPRSRDTDDDPQRLYLTLKEEKKIIQKQRQTGLNINNETGEILIPKAVRLKRDKRVVKKPIKLNL
jgi:hypothetical protein